MSELVKIYDWEIANNRVFGYIVGHPLLGSGRGNTSPIVSRDGNLVTTQSGTEYELKQPCKEQQEKDRMSQPQIRSCCKCNRSVEVKPGTSRGWTYRDGVWTCDTCRW